MNKLKRLFGSMTYIFILSAAYFFALDLNILTIKDGLPSTYVDVITLFNRVLLQPLSLTIFVLLSLLGFYAHHRQRSTLKVSMIVLSGLLAFFQVLGRHYFLSFYLQDMLDNSFILLFNFGVSFVYFYKVLTWVNLSKWTIASNLKLKNLHVFGASFLIILLAGLPYLFYFYPGTVHWDGLAQLNQFFGISVWDNHYPALSTYLFGTLMQVGNHLFDDNFGIFLYTFIQYIFSSFILAYAVAYVAKKTKNILMTLLVLLFFAFYPVWPINAITYVKDTYYYLFFLLLVIQISIYYDSSNRVNWFYFIKVSIALTGMWLFRNDGFYVVMITLLIWIVWEHRDLSARILSMLFLFFVVLNATYHQVVLPHLNVLEGSPREMMSIPLQQVARYCKYESESLTTNDLLILEDVFLVSCARLGELYNPETSDNIKMYFLYNPSLTQIQQFSKLWLNKFLHRPDIYFDAFLENYYGYFYPMRREYKDGIAWFSIQYSEPVYTGDFDLYMLDHRFNHRMSIERFVNNLRQTRVIELFFNVGTFVWMLIILFFFMLRERDYKKLIVFVPSIVTLAICLVSPVNAYVRYVLPIIVSIPILLTLFIKRSP